MWVRSLGRMLLNSQSHKPVIKVYSSCILIWRVDWGRNGLQVYSNCSQNLLPCRWRIYIPGFCWLLARGYFEVLEANRSSSSNGPHHRISYNMATCFFKVDKGELDTLARQLLDVYIFTLTYVTVHWLEASSMSHSHFRWGDFTQARYQNAGIMEINLKSAPHYAKRKQADSEQVQKLVLNT